MLALLEGQVPPVAGWAVRAEDLVLAAVRVRRAAPVPLAAESVLRVAG